MKVLAWGRAGIGLAGVFLAAIGVTAMTAHLCSVALFVEIAPRSFLGNGSVPRFHLALLQTGIGIGLMILASQIFQRLPSFACEAPRNFLRIGITLLGFWLGLVFAIVTIRGLRYGNAPWQFWMTDGVGLATALLFLGKARTIAQYILTTRSANIVSIPL